MIIGFDYDGTLVKSWTATPLPGVRGQLAALPCPNLHCHKPGWACFPRGAERPKVSDR